MKHTHLLTYFFLAAFTCGIVSCSKDEKKPAADTTTAATDKDNDKTSGGETFDATALVANWHYENGQNTTDLTVRADNTFSYKAVEVTTSFGSPVENRTSYSGTIKAEVPSAAEVANTKKLNSRKEPGYKVVFTPSSSSSYPVITLLINVTGAVMQTSTLKTDGTVTSNVTYTKK